jgi:transposase
MLSLSRAVKIYLASAPMDMRRGHDGLFAVVRSMGLDPFSGHLFAFVGKRGDRIKILVFERGGFLLLYKRLEKGRFRIPRIPDSGLTVALDSTELSMLLDGIDVQRVRRPLLWEPKVAASG